jgi:hypothetical protein
MSKNQFDPMGIAKQATSKQTRHGEQSDQQERRRYLEQEISSPMHRINSRRTHHSTGRSEAIQRGA